MMESDTISYEDLIYQKIKEAGERGIPQRELIKELGLDNRTANLIIKKLIDKKKIRKKSVKENGKNIIKLYVNEEEISINIWVNLDSVTDIPCFTCKNLNKCGNGSIINPSTCTSLSRYILSNISASG
jgi:hypothetical protein